MFKVNARYGTSHKFFDISQYLEKNGKKKFIAWFYRDFKNLEELNDGD